MVAGKPGKGQGAPSSRRYFGSLLVGYYGPAELLYAGRVGTGFSERALAALYDGMQKIKRETCPFVNLPEKSRGRFGQGITPAMMRRCTWVEPVLVAQVKFTEWALDDQLRQPVFLGLRTDKQPKDVVRDSRSLLKAGLHLRRTELAGAVSWGLRPNLLRKKSRARFYRSTLETSRRSNVVRGRSEKYAV